MKTPLVVDIIKESISQLRVFYCIFLSFKFPLNYLKKEESIRARNFCEEALQRNFQSNLRQNKKGWFRER